MRFWDSSAIVPLCVKELYSQSVKNILVEDPDMVVWWNTRIEWTSALMRQVREGTLTPSDERVARRVLWELTQTWMEIQPSEHIRDISESLLPMYPLRAADAMQLAAAIQWRQRLVIGNEFVSLDRRLRDAACSEGFNVLPEVI